MAGILNGLAPCGLVQTCAEFFRFGSGARTGRPDAQNSDYAEQNPHERPAHPSLVKNACGTEMQISRTRDGIGEFGGDIDCLLGTALSQRRPACDLVHGTHPTVPTPYRGSDRTALPMLDYSRHDSVFRGGMLSQFRGVSTLFRNSALFSSTPCEIAA
jgi:hypothetical protein